jgi:hypothetical protein
VFRHFLFFLCSLVLAVQVLVIAGCGGSSTKTSSAGGSSPNASSALGCGGSGHGYDNTSGVGVWLQSPSPGQNQSHVQVNATAYVSDTVSKWMVCLDDQPVYQANSTAGYISQGIDMSPGQHLLYARAWDAKGNSNRSEVALIQVGPPSPSNTALPTPPADAQVLTELQNDSSNWSICTVCAAGTNNAGDYWMKPDQSQPSRSGSSLEMYANGPQWSNVLFMDKILGTNNKTNFLWDFWVYHDPAAEAHFWASEFDFWIVLGGKEFMIGSQCDFGDGYWSTWDSEGGRWVLNGIPCTHWTPGWHHVQWYLERTGPDSYRYDTLVFDGHGYGLNQSWKINDTTWPDMIGVQFQLDQDPTGTPLHEWVDDVTLTIW